MGIISKVSDLPMCSVSVSLLLRNGEKLRVGGRIVKKRGDKYLIARQSPKHSYGPGTKVHWYRKKKND